MQRLESLSLNRIPVKLGSYDFESLYSNIDLNHALIIITEFMKNNISMEEYTIIGFHHILKLVFNNNIFSFNKNKFYKQVTGIAMGSKCGPTIANIYLYCLEKSFLTIHKPIFYGRYIDDVFSIFKKEFDTKILLNFFGYLKLNEVCADRVDFLDLTIYFDGITDKLKFNLYTKPTQTYSYLVTDSNHPDFIHKNIPKGIFIRVRRICTSITEYYYNSIKIWTQLKSRGYDSRKVKAIICELANQDRDALLLYKNKKPSENLELGVVPFIYENIFHNFRENVMKCLEKLISEFEYIDGYYNMTHKMQPNIGALVINKIPSMLFDINDTMGYIPCNKINCLVCPFNIKIKELWELDPRMNSSILIKSNSN